MGAKRVKFGAEVCNAATYASRYVTYFILATEYKHGDSVGRRCYNP